MCLTQDNSNALHLTLNGVVSLIKLLLNKGVLTTTFRQEAFKVIDWKENSEIIVGLWVDVCYISVGQIMNSLVLQRLKLFSQPEIEEVVIYSKGECCTASLTEFEIFMLDGTFSLKTALSNIEESSSIYQGLLRGESVLS